MRFARTALMGVASFVVAVVVFAAEATPPSPISSLPAPQPQSSAVLAEELRPVTQADGCGSTPLSCNTDVRGRLAGGDCLSSNGTLFDEYAFSGSAQELVTATVRPLISTYSNAWIGLVVPLGYPATAPLISGGPAATIHYVLPVSGPWKVQAGTNDRFASGDYLLELACSDAPPPSQFDCVEQDLLCGQQATWSLTSQSCTSSSDPNRVYSMYRIYGVAGDTLTMRLTSSAFDPQFGIYEFAKSGLSLAESSPSNATTDTLTFAVPHDGFYDMVVTSGNAHGTGQYVLALDCIRSGCLTPIITRQPEDVTVPLLANAALSVEATALGDVDYEWFDAAGAQPNVGSGAKITTTPVTAPHTYFVTATTPCGTATSRFVHVQPAAPPPPPPPPRHRAARH